METKLSLFEESKKINKDNIGVLQAINVVYITIIFVLFILGIMFLGITSLFIAGIILPSFSISYNYIAYKSIKNEEIRVKDIFKGRKAILGGYIQYYNIYKKPIWWSILAFFIANILFSFIFSAIYINKIGIDVIMENISNITSFYEEMFNDELYNYFIVINEVLSIIVAYFVFTLTRKKYQFIPIISLNIRIKLEKINQLSLFTYNKYKKIIKEANLKLLLQWIVSLFIAVLTFICLFDILEINFDISITLSIYIFLFIGSFSISKRVIFKNLIYIKELELSINDVKEKISQKGIIL